MSKINKVAVIGLGNIGNAVATNLVSNNHEIIVASRERAAADDFATKSKGLAHAEDVAEAIKKADIIIPAVWFNTIKEFFIQYAEALEGKTIVDVSNPIAPDEKGGFKKIIGENESAGLLNAAILPKGAKLVKAFGTLGAASLAAAANQSPEKAVLFYASDDTTVNESIETLIKDSGFDPVRVGGLDQSIRIEVFGDLHEFGALGKTVTLAEAKKKV